MQVSKTKVRVYRSSKMICGSKTAGSDDSAVKDWQSFKRERQDSPEATASLEGCKKIRKDGENQATSPRSNFNEVPAKDDAYDIQNDSVLLGDLLSDFDDPIETTNQEILNQSQSEETGHVAFDGEFDDLFQEDFHTPSCTENQADLCQFRECKILEVDKQKRHTTLLVMDTQDETKASVECHGFWKSISVAENQLVSIRAKKNGASGWTVDNDNGLIIIEPHQLVSGTTVVGANFCHRRGVLAEYFRGLDSLPNLEIADYGMTVGILVHEILQKVLSRRLFTEAEIRKVALSTLNSKRTARMLYEVNLSLAQCEKQLESYVPKIANFVSRYFARNGKPDGGGTGGRAGGDNNFKGTIESVREIEENIWLPELGLKGKVDVTVEARVGKTLKVMPLEVKTGRPSFSTEHRGQLILYAMMLDCLGEKVDAGLLLYIRENLIEEVRSSHPDRRDLIILRNTLVNYLSKSPERECVEEANLNTWKLMELPEPINHKVACPKCPYATLCSVYAERDKNLHLAESHVLRDIARESTSHLSPEHVDYVLRWITILRLEESSGRNLSALRDVWMLEPRTREKKGTCISDLRVEGGVAIEGDWYRHTFVRKPLDESIKAPDPIRSVIEEQEYVIVSTDTRINLSSGYVKSKTNHAIEILLDRNVQRQSPDATFHIDRYPSSGGLTSKNLSNVACLLNDNEITNNLRRIVIDRTPASFVEKLPRSILEKCAPLLADLNKNQRKAIIAVFSANDYILIKGLPGTGKTRTLVALVEMLVKLDRSVLITSHTHNAIDNLLLKLDKKGVDFLRLGSESRVNPALLYKSENVATADCDTPESLARLYASKKVVAVTCMGATHSLVARRIFDVCLVDESTQVLQPTVLRPIYSAKKFVLVGDPQQLGPLVQNNEAKKMGMDESLFTRLDSENNTTVLKLQYRMNSKIMLVANELTYGGSLITGDREVADATLRIADPMVLESCERWVRKALSPKIEDSVVMLNTGETFGLRERYEIMRDIKKNETSIRNIFEAAIVLRLVAVLRKGGLVTSSIGVICPYSAQVELLRDLLQDIEVNTVDQYQGRDKEVIIYSCTKSVPGFYESAGEFEILQDERRLTVAVTRAKHKLVVIGDIMSLRRYAPFEKLLKIVAADTIDLEPGRDNFNWEGLGSLIRKK